MKMGYEVEVVVRNRFKSSCDFFGLWDLICVGAYDIRFIQVKTNCNPSREWQDRASAWGPDNSTFYIKEYIVYKDYKSKGDIPSIRVTLAPSY